MVTRIVTGHAGAEWAPIAALTLPALEAYCGRHGYELWDVPLAQYAEGRPSSWGKVPALVRALHDADLAVWIDADALVMAGAPAIHGELFSGSWHGLVFHRVPEGYVPNCGVWLIAPDMTPVLQAVWADYAPHRWWEQAAVCRLMGFDPDDLPVHHARCTELSQHTTVLDNRWNAHPQDWRDGAFIRHASGVPSLEARVAMLSAWLAPEAVTC